MQSLTLFKEQFHSFNIGIYNLHNSLNLIQLSEWFHIDQTLFATVMLCSSKGLLMVDNNQYPQIPWNVSTEHTDRLMWWENITNICMHYCKQFKVHKFSQHNITYMVSFIFIICNFIPLLGKWRTVSGWNIHHGRVFPNLHCFIQIENAGQLVQKAKSTWGRVEVWEGKLVSRTEWLRAR